MADHNYFSHHSSEPVVHHSPWLIATESGGPRGFVQKVLADGALVAADGLIREVGPYREIRREYSRCKTREHEGRVLVPGLVNGHCHLELSHLNLAGPQLKQPRYQGGFTRWIRDLLAARAGFLREHADADRLILQEAGKTLQQMADQGVVFVGDVGNSPASRNIGGEGSVRVCFLLELLGLSRESEQKALARLEKVYEDDSRDLDCTPHAPYSTPPAVIQAVKSRAARQGRTISIHAAESLQEVEFLASGTGEFREFLQERGAWDGSFTIPASGVIEYLNRLGVLDSRTICVHGVHVKKAEIVMLAEQGAKVCLCPGSNRFLGVGKAPVTEYLEHGILPALGTDSRASNDTLSLWREMRLLREDHPGLEPETVFAMASRGGAEAWGIEAEIGALEPGRRALLLAVAIDEKINSPREIFEFLTSAGESVQLERLG